MKPQIKRFQMRMHQNKDRKSINFIYNASKMYLFSVQKQNESIVLPCAAKKIIEGNSIFPSKSPPTQYGFPSLSLMCLKVYVCV